MSNVVLVTEEEAQVAVREAELSANDLALAVSTAQLKTPDDYASLGTIYRQVRQRSRLIDQQRKELTRPLDETKKRIMDFFGRALDTLTRAEGLAKSKMGTWMHEQEHLRQERERKLREQEALRLKKDQEETEKRAAKLEAKGLVEEAEVLREAVPLAPPPIVAPTTVPKVEGLHTREDWDFEVVDALAIPREYLAVDLKKVQAVVKAMKAMTDIPGVRAFVRLGFVSKG